MSSKKNRVLKKLLNFESDDNKLQFEMEQLHLDFIYQVQQLMKEEGVTKADLAKKLNTSKSYITQLFNGGRLFNPKLIAKINRVFDNKFAVCMPVTKTVYKPIVKTVPVFVETHQPYWIVKDIKTQLERQEDELLYWGHSRVTSSHQHSFKKWITADSSIHLTETTDTHAR